MAISLAHATPVLEKRGLVIVLYTSRSNGRQLALAQFPTSPQNAHCVGVARAADWKWRIATFVGDSLQALRTKRGDLSYQIHSWIPYDILLYLSMKWAVRVLQLLHTAHRPDFLASCYGLRWKPLLIAINHALHKQYTLSTIPLEWNKMCIGQSPDPFSLYRGRARQTTMAMWQSFPPVGVGIFCQRFQ